MSIALPEDFKMPTNFNLHDQVFCGIFSSRAEFAQDIFVLKFAPQIEQGLIDLDSLQLRDSALHHPNASKRLADVVYEVQVVDVGQLLFTLFLMEHKSGSISGAVKQLAQQVIRAYAIHQHVVPVLIVQNLSPLKLQEYIQDQARRVLGVKEVHMPFVLLQTSEITHKQLLDGRLTAAPVWAILKYRWQVASYGTADDKGQAQPAVALILKALRRTRPEYKKELFATVGGYMQKLNTALNAEVLHDIEHQSLQPGEEPIVNEIFEFNPDRAREKGRQEGLQTGLKQGTQQGMQKGIQQGMQKGEYEMMLKVLRAGGDAQTVAQAAGLPIEKVLALKNKG